MFNVFLVFINIIAMIIGYFLIKYKIEKKFINNEIISRVKKELNSIMIQLNEATLTNINLLEDKIQNLNKFIILSDKKIAGLKKNQSEKLEMPLSKPAFVSHKNPQTKKVQDELQNDYAYSPKKVVKQNLKSAEIKSKELEESINIVDEQIKDIPIGEKALVLLKNGFSAREIQKKLGITSGEFELLVNIEKLSDLSDLGR